MFYKIWVHFFPWVVVVWVFRVIRALESSWTGSSGNSKHCRASWSMGFFEHELTGGFCFSPWWTLEGNWFSGVWHHCLAFWTCMWLYIHREMEKQLILIPIFLFFLFSSVALCVWSCSIHDEDFSWWVISDFFCFQLPIFYLCQQ